MLRETRQNKLALQSLLTGYKQLTHSCKQQVIKQKTTAENLAVVLIVCLNLNKITGVASVGHITSAVLVESSMQRAPSSQKLLTTDAKFLPANFDSLAHQLVLLAASITCSVCCKKYQHNV